MNEDTNLKAIKTFNPLTFITCISNKNQRIKQNLSNYFEPIRQMLLVEFLFHFVDNSFERFRMIHC